MKKLLTAILALILMFSVIPGGNIEAASSINKQAGKVYADILERYIEVYKAKQNNYEYYSISKSSDDDLAVGYASEIGDFNIVSEFMMEAQTGGLIYRIMDWNKDGTPELFIANPKGKIYAAFTYNQGNAVYLMSSFQTTNCVLCKDGIIGRWVEGGAGGNVWIDKISKNKLKHVVELGSYYEGKMFYTQTKNGKTTNISETKYTKLSKKYCKPLKVKFYKADNKAVKNIRNGKFAYSNQKSWKIKGTV